MFKLNKYFLNISFLIIGILLLIGYQDCVFGEFWQVSILAIGIMTIVWSQLFLFID
jgi:hypothetical protein